MFVHEVELRHPVAVVWGAITRKSEVDEYYLAPLGCDIGAAGSEIYYGQPSRRLITGRVLSSETRTRLMHTFRFAGEGERESVVTYDLTSTGDGTLLRIEHEGYAEDSQSYCDIACGWPIIADGLAALLDRRKPGNSVMREEAVTA